MPTSKAIQSRRMMKIFVEPESTITKKFLAGWYLAWLSEAAEQAGLDPSGSKKELVDRIRVEVRKGNRRVIRRFDRCA